MDIKGRTNDNNEESPISHHHTSLSSVNSYSLSSLSKATVKRIFRFYLGYEPRVSLDADQLVLGAVGCFLDVLICETERACREEGRTLITNKHLYNAVCRIGSEKMANDMNRLLLAAATTLHNNNNNNGFSGQRKKSISCSDIFSQSSSSSISNSNSINIQDDLLTERGGKEIENNNNNNKIKGKRPSKSCNGKTEVLMAPSSIIQDIIANICCTPPTNKKSPEITKEETVSSTLTTTTTTTTTDPNTTVSNNHPISKATQPTNEPEDGIEKDDIKMFEFLVDGLL